ALAVRNREAIYGRARRIAKSNLALLDRLFRNHKDTVDWVRPAGGMTAFPWITGGTDAREFCRAMMRHGVLLSAGDCFGMPNHFRLGFAASGEKFAAALERLDLAIGQSSARHETAG